MFAFLKRESPALFFRNLPAALPQPDRIQPAFANWFVICSQRRLKKLLFMSRIVTITLNPAMDKSTSIDGLVPESKLRCAVPVFEPGGGGVNVSRALHRLGLSSTAFFFSGGHTGRYYQELVEAQGIACVPIEIREPTRENFIVVDRRDGHQYRFGMPGPTISGEEWEHLLNSLRSMESCDYLVASGSLAPGLPADAYAQIAALARDKGARFVIDSSGEGLKMGLVNGAFIAKPNIGELSKLAGKAWLEPDQVESTAREVLAKYQISVLLVSRGAEGASLVTATEYFEQQPPKVERKSTVGAGDSMVAGLLFGWEKTGNWQEALRYAVAAGTAATLNPGTELCAESDVHRLYEQMRGE